MMERPQNSSQEQTPHSPQVSIERTPSGLLRRALRAPKIMVNRLARLLNVSPISKKNDDVYGGGMEDLYLLRHLQDGQLSGKSPASSDHRTSTPFLVESQVQASSILGSPHASNNIRESLSTLDIDLSEMGSVGGVQNNSSVKDKGPNDRKNGFSLGDHVRGDGSTESHGSRPDIANFFYDLDPQDVELSKLAAEINQLGSGVSNGSTGPEQLDVDLDKLQSMETGVQADAEPYKASPGTVDIDLFSVGISVRKPPEVDRNTFYSREEAQLLVKDQMDKSSRLARQELAEIVLPKKSGKKNILGRLLDRSRSYFEKGKARDVADNTSLPELELDLSDTQQSNFLDLPKKIEPDLNPEVPSLLQDPDPGKDISERVKKVAYYLECLRNNKGYGTLGPNDLEALVDAQRIFENDRKKQVGQHQENAGAVLDKSPGAKARRSLLLDRKNIHEVLKGFRSGPRWALSSGLVALGLLVPIGTVNNGSLTTAATSESVVNIVAQAVVRTPDMGNFSSAPAIMGTTTTNMAFIRPGDTFTSIAVNSLIPEVFTPEVLEKISPELKKTFVANVINNLSSDQLKLLGVTSGNANHIKAGKTIDIKLLANMAKQMTVVVDGTKVPLVSQVSKMIHS